jgi:rRNA processing protein Gar1
VISVLFEHHLVFTVGHVLDVIKNVVRRPYVIRLGANDEKLREKGENSQYYFYGDLRRGRTKADDEESKNKKERRERRGDDDDLPAS